MSAAPKAAMSAKQAGWLYTSPSGRTQHAAPIEDREQGLCDEGWTETPLYSADTIAALRKDVARFHAAFRALAITSVTANPRVLHHYRCAYCGGRWSGRPPVPEKHSDSCIAAIDAAQSTEGER